MAQSKPVAETPPRQTDLGARIDRYRQLIEKVVREVGEHPQCELKHSCSLANLAQKIELVKDIQSIATSRIETEKFLIIGADEPTRSFVPVKNIEEFDDATICQLLAKYLNPVPDFELFRLETSDGSLCVVFVFPRQRTRRILAKVTVPDDSGDLKPKLLLREGDLWTKGASTGKRLATPDDWDEIYEEIVEAEAEERAKTRTAHFLEQALAHERLRASLGVSPLPAYVTDEEFRALLEQLCTTQDTRRFRLLLEGLRDDLVEGWHIIGGYDEASVGLTASVDSFQSLKEQIADHKKNVFLPAIKRLTSAGLLVVKNDGPKSFLESVTDLLKETFESCHRLKMLRHLADVERVSANYFRNSGQKPREHLGHTVPALESLIALHLIGAYVCKRRQFQYLSALFRADVHRSGQNFLERPKKQPMAFGPLSSEWGEPEGLRHRGGRINLCASRVEAESAYLKLFGSRTVAIETLCQYEFCLEFNSYLSVKNDVTADSTAYVEKQYPDLNFNFRACLIAFPFEPFMNLALGVYKEIRQRKRDLLKLILFDEALAGFLATEGGDRIFTNFLKGLVHDQTELFLQLNRFPPDITWPKELGEGGLAASGLGLT